MQYVICNGDRRLKYLTIFNSVEDCISYLHFMYDFVWLIIEKVRSIHIQTVCYNCNLCYKGYTSNIDLLIYGVKGYEEI